jgi:hypothetical protein
MHEPVDLVLTHREKELLNIAVNSLLRENEWLTEKLVQTETCLKLAEHLLGYDEE